MRPRQTMKDRNNIEVVLFPLEYLDMSQDEGGDYSHQNTYNIDFLGFLNGSVVQNAPYYAPVTLKCVNDSFDPSANVRVYESVNQVHFADGTIDYLTIMFAHDNYPIHSLGSVINQGDLLGHTGTAGQVTGDHVHTCCGKGTYQGFTQREGGHWDLTNRCHYWDATFVNSTPIIQGYGHNWRRYTPDSPTIGKQKHFKWVLYANTIRNRNLT